MNWTELERTLVTASLAVALLAIAVNPALSQHHGFSAPSKEAERREVKIPIRDFSLTDQDHKPLRFQTLRGRVVLVSFIYSSCPDVCPLMTAGMRQVQEELGPGERRSVLLLSVTTDAEIDTPEVLKSYAERYNTDFVNWSFVTGTLQSLTPVWKAFGVNVQRKARGLVSHTSLTALVDKEGVMRYAYYGAAPDSQKVLRDLRNLLADR